MRIFLKAVVLTAAFCAAVSPSWGEKISASLPQGRQQSLEGYKIGSNHFLNAKQAGALYGGQVQWQAVSGRVQMSFRGRRMQFQVGSSRVQMGDKTHVMESAVMLRSNQAFIPLSFFLSEAFESFSGMDSEFNERTKTLVVEKLSNVEPARFFSHEGYTRVAFEIGEDLSYSATARGLSGIDVSVALGVVSSTQEAVINDGVIAGYSLLQEANAVRLQVRLARPGLSWKVSELSDPRRLVLDVFGDGQKPSGLPAAGVPSAVAAVSREANRRWRVVIDAGHGGKDSGALGRRGTMEKDVNLRAAKELAKLLKQNSAFEVLLTREDDTFVPLAERSRIANEAAADLFISLHCNGSSNGAETGYEVYFLSEKASDPGAERTAEMENSVLTLEGKSIEEERAEGILHAMQATENINSASELAALVIKALEGRVDLDNRGVKQAAFYVLRGTYVPAILVEMAFVTNKKDEAKLDSKRYRRRLVEGIHAGVLDYARRRGWLERGGR